MTRYPLLHAAMDTIITGLDGHQVLLLELAIRPSPVEVTLRRYGDPDSQVTEAVGAADLLTVRGGIDGWMNMWAMEANQHTPGWTLKPESGLWTKMFQSTSWRPFYGEGRISARYCDHG